MNPADESLFDLYYEYPSGPLGMLPYNYTPLSVRELRGMVDGGLSFPDAVYNVRLAVQR